MSNYKATVIKTGNSYALRVPKAYADSNNFELGEKVELPNIKRVKKRQDRAGIQKAFKELQDLGAFRSIKDPVSWQREVRKDRPLPGRN